jgi:hypothetical protein
MFFQLGEAAHPEERAAIEAALNEAAQALGGIYMEHMWWHQFFYNGDGFSGMRYEYMDFDSTGSMSLEVTVHFAVPDCETHWATYKTGPDAFTRYTTTDYAGYPAKFYQHGTDTYAERELLVKVGRYILRTSDYKPTSSVGVIVRNQMDKLFRACSSRGLFEYAATPLKTTLLELIGDVEVKIGDEEDDDWEEAEPGMTLEEIAYISTGFESKVKLQLSDGRVLTIKEMTQIRIAQFYDPELRSATELLLRIGRLNAVVKKASDKKVISETSFKVRTPTATMSVRGTQFDLETDINGVGQIKVADGIVDLTTTDAAGTVTTRSLYAGDTVSFAPDTATTTMDVRMKLSMVRTPGEPWPWQYEDDPLPALMGQVTQMRETRSINFAFSEAERSRWRSEDMRWTMTGGALAFAGDGRGGAPRVRLSQAIQSFEGSFLSELNAACPRWGVVIIHPSYPDNWHRMEFQSDGSWSVFHGVEGEEAELAQGVGGPGLGSHGNRIQVDNEMLRLWVDENECFAVNSQVPAHGFLAFYAEDAPGASIVIRNLQLQLSYVDFDEDGLPDDMEGRLIGRYPDLPVFSVEEIEPEDDLDGDGFTQEQEANYWMDPCDPSFNPVASAGTVELQHEWTRLYGNAGVNRFYDAAVGDDGILYVTGYSFGSLDGTSTDQADAILAAFNRDGQLLWSTEFGDPTTSDYGYSLSLAPNGRIAVCGETKGGLDGWSNQGDRDAFVAVFSSTGVQEWSTCFGGLDRDEARGVSSTENGDILVCGRTGSDLNGLTHAGNNDGYVMCFDAQGNHRWTQSWSTPEGDNISSAIPLPDASILLAGYVGGDIEGEGIIGDRCVCLQALSMDGEVLWTRMAGTSGVDYLLDDNCIRTMNGDIVVGGRTYGAFSADEGFGEGDAFAIRFSPEGVPLWEFSWGTSQIDDVTGIVETSNGLLAVATASPGDWPDHPSEGSNDIALHLFDRNGHPVAQTHVASPGFDYAYQLLAHGNQLFMIGHTDGDLHAQPNHGLRDGFISSWKIVETPPEPPAYAGMAIHDFKLDQFGCSMRWSPQLHTRYRLEMGTDLENGFTTLEDNLRSAVFHAPHSSLPPSAFFRIIAEPE